MTDDAVLLEEAPEVPASLLSPLWGTLLSLGGLVLVVGSLGYAVVQMSAYESEIAGLKSRLSETPEAPEAAVIPETTPTPTDTPSAQPTALPTVYVTETVAATPAPTRAPPRQPPAGAADVDRTRQLQAQVTSLQRELDATRAERDRLRRDAAASQQCQSRLGEAQQALERARNLCRTTGAVIAPRVPRPQ